MDTNKKEYEIKKSHIIKLTQYYQKLINKDKNTKDDGKTNNK